MKSFADAVLGDIGIVRKMLDENPQLAKADIDGCSMLHHVAGHNRTAAIRLLIERGADPNAYWVGNLHTPLSWAVTVDHPEACKTLIECGAKLDLFCAAGLGRLDDVCSFFDEAGHVRPGASMTGSSRRRADDSRITEVSTDPIEIISDALYIACRSGRVDVAMYLLDHGADPSFRGYMGASCFHWAYFGGGDPKLIQAILARGGDPKSTWGERRLTPRAFGIFTTAGWGWLYYIKRILDIDPSLASLSECGTTALHEATKNGNLEMVKILSEHGADVWRVDAQGKTALELALQSGRQAVVDWLSAHR